MQSVPLVLSINDDGTVTIRCSADAFFARADEFRRLLTEGEGEGEDEGQPAAPSERTFADLWEELGARPWGRDLSPASARALAAGYYLTRERGLAAFSAADLQEVLGEAPGSGALAHLARRGWLERVRRGAYLLSARGLERIESQRELALRPAAPARSEPELPNLMGLSRFLRGVPTTRKWRRVLLLAYFLQEHCGVAEFDHRLLAACFRRLRGQEVPGSLASLLSQQLCKQRGLLERSPKRGHYRLTDAAREALRHEPGIARADDQHRSRRAG